MENKPTQPETMTPNIPTETEQPKHFIGSSFTIKNNEFPVGKEIQSSQINQFTVDGHTFEFNFANNDNFRNRLGRDDNYYFGERNLQHVRYGLKVLGDLTTDEQKRVVVYQGDPTKIDNIPITTQATYWALY